jgi:hypothetical protein
MMPRTQGDWINLAICKTIGSPGLKPRFCNISGSSGKLSIAAVAPSSCLAAGCVWCKLLIVSTRGNRRLAWPPHRPRRPRGTMSIGRSCTAASGGRCQGGILESECVSDRGRCASAIPEEGAEGAGTVRSARPLLGRRDHSDPEGCTRHPRDRRAGRITPTASQPQPRAQRPRTGRDLPPGARARWFRPTAPASLAAAGGVLVCFA